jgi:hypothetical protein
VDESLRLGVGRVEDDVVPGRVDDAVVLEVVHAIRDIRLEAEDVPAERDGTSGEESARDNERDEHAASVAPSSRRMDGHSLTYV